MNILILLFIISIGLNFIFEPNVEKNTETGEYLLFYSNIFNNFERKYIKLW
jgi:hypothetical protein